LQLSKQRATDGRAHIYMDDVVIVDGIAITALYAAYPQVLVGLWGLINRKTWDISVEVRRNDEVPFTEEDRDLALRAATAFCAKRDLPLSAEPGRDWVASGIWSFTNFCGVPADRET